MQTIPVIFGANDDLISLAIRLRTWSRYPHVAAVMPDKRYIIEARGGHGVIKTPYHEFKSRYKRTLETHMPVVNAEQAYEFLHSKLGADYDYEAFWGMGFRLNLNDKEKYVCSELLAEAGGIIHQDYWHKTHPQHLYQIRRDAA